MKQFIQRHGDKITGILSGFDRIVFRGTLRRISFPDGMKSYLDQNHVLLKHFGDHAQSVTKRIREASERSARESGRPLQYLPSSRTRKEACAQRMLKSHPLSKGLIGIVSSLEVGPGFEIHRNREARLLQIQYRLRKCLVLYHYFLDPFFGFMYARLQTWFPFAIQVGINAREWLAGQMDRAGIGYRRRDNCFPRIDDVARAQQIMDQFATLDWPRHLRSFSDRLNPIHREIFARYPVDYYWTVHQSEWASDVMFKDAASLAAIYPGLVRHAMTCLSSADIMRFLGRRVRDTFPGEIVSDFKDRPEGVRIKHRIDSNSVKLYDKQGSVLRPETTIDDPSDFKVYRRPEGDPHGELRWRPLRKGVADIRRRAQLSQASNARYLDALASADTSIPLGDLIRPVCRPAALDGKRVRGLRPWAEADLPLLQAVSRGEFVVSGFRNDDIRRLLFPLANGSTADRRRHSARVTRLIRILRGHGLIRKIPQTHRYRVSSKGRQFLAAILTAQTLTMDQIQKCAA